MANKTLSTNKIDKKFKKLSQKNQTLLTFGEKTDDKISASNAVKTLLDRSHHQNYDHFTNIIHEFSNQTNYSRHQNKQNKNNKGKNNKKRTKKQKNIIEYLNKKNNDNDKFESSSKSNTQSNKRSFSKMNNDNNNNLFSAKLKKQKTEIIKDYYSLHWNTRFEDRQCDIYPIIKEKRRSIMKQMDNIKCNDYCCFIDNDCESFKIVTNINSKILNCHKDVINGYNLYRKKKKKNILSYDDGLLLSSLSTYRDVIYNARNWKNDKNIKQILSIHILSHILRNNDIKNKNDLKLNENKLILTDDNDYLIRDCGFKRLSVLIITPFRENVNKFGQCILENLPKTRQIKNERYKKFQQLYGKTDEEKKNDIRNRGKGLDFMYTFSGNIDDDFWSGISINKQSINFLQTWNESDIMFISPLRLKLLFENGKTKDGQSIFDFFSSIEIMIIDQCDIIEMQNIKHLFDTIHKINWHPKLYKDQDIKNVNFNRLRYCYIDDVAQFYRQNILISKYQTPKIKQLFQSKFSNIFGKIKIQLKYNGILEKVIPFVRQEFYRFDIKQILNNNNNNNKQKKDIDINELRLEKYKKYILPIFRKNSGIKTLIFVSSYYDFLRLRKLYSRNNNNNNNNNNYIAFLSEYTTIKQENKYRKEFNDKNNRNIMYLVITERYYFYKRIRCLGAKRILFYSLPLNHDFYYQILNWFDTTQQFESYALYCKNYDNLSLQKIVGLNRMIKMLNDSNKIKVFV